MGTKKKEIEMQEEVKFTKTDLLNAKHYFNKKDLVTAIIPEDFHGTIEKADSLIEKYMKGKVK